MLLWLRRWLLWRKYLRYRREADAYSCGTRLLNELRPDLERRLNEIVAETKAIEEAKP